MAANKRKQDERHLKQLREMVALQHNKQCFDCHQRGPTYVNMTIGSFVCTSCSGMLRGLNPPHRVKSISMTSFTPEEMEFLRGRGNEFCRKVWLGIYDSRTNPEPDSKDEQKVKDFMMLKYEKKRFYVAPTDAMHEEARQHNTPAPKQNDTKRSMGNSIPAPRTTQSPTLSAPPTGANTQPIQRPQASSNNTAPTQAPTQQPAAAASKPQASGLDLLSDLGADPFAPQPAAPVNQTTPGGGFASFANFGAPSSQQSAFPSSSSTGMFPPPSQAAPFSSTTSSTSAPGGFNAFPPMSSAPEPASNPAPPQMSAGDRYAALADLDGVFGSGGGANVNWNGQGPPPVAQSNGGSVWGSQSGGNAQAVPPSSNTGSIWGVQPNSNPSQVSQASNQQPFPSSANPFGGGSTNVSSATSNPFGGAPPTSSSGFASFGGPPAGSGGFGAPGSFGAPGGFGGQFGAATSQPQQVMPPPPQQGQFGVQNGGFGGGAGYPQGASPPSQWGFPQQPPPSYSTAAGLVSPQGAAPGLGGGFASAPGMQTKAPTAVPPMGYGAPQGFGGWPQQQQQAPQSNPFMGASMGQPIPPRANSTNPFL